MDRDLLLMQRTESVFTAAARSKTNPWKACELGLRLAPLKAGGVDSRRQFLGESTGNNTFGSVFDAAVCPPFAGST